MNRLLSIILALSFLHVGCARLLRREYTPVEVCETLCLASAGVSTACAEQTGILSPLSTAVTTADCMTQCDNNYDLYERIDAACVLEKYAMSDYCPVLEDCL